jgi:hypothetical protein
MRSTFTGISMEPGTSKIMGKITIGTSTGGDPAPTGGAWKRAMAGREIKNARRMAKASA